MQNTVEEVIKSLQQPAYCFICEVTLSVPINADQHYASIRHKKKVKAFYNNILEKQLKSNPTVVIKKVQTVARAEVVAPQKEQTLCNICNVYFETNLTKQHYQESEHKRNEQAYCNICNILTMSKEQLWQHLHGSKHAKKRKETGLPTLNVQHGPFDPQLPQSLTKVMLARHCQLCDAKFPTIRHALDHYHSQRHRSAVLKVQNEKKPDDIINKSVLEKTNMVQTSKPTKKPLLKNSGLYCALCEVRYPTKELLEIHCTTTLHVENERKNRIAVREDYENYEPVDSFAGDSNNENILKGKVFQEIEKLIETLSLSKKVPYEIALKYLKKCNKEIEVIKKQYEQKKSQKKSDNGSGVQKEVDEKHIQEKQSKRLHNQELLSEDDYHSFSSDTVLSNETETVFNLIDFSDHLSARKVPDETQSNVNPTYFYDNLNVAESNSGNNSDKEVLTASDKTMESDDDEGTSQKIEHSNQRNNDFPFPLENVGNFEIMAQEITLLKSQLEAKYPNEENLEKNVVTEIERLINSINSNDIPPAVLLEYLQNFNEELNLRGVGEVKNGTGDRYKTKANQEVLFRYSKEDLTGLRTTKTFTDRLDMQLRMRINEARIWNKQCNDLDLD